KSRVQLGNTDSDQKMKNFLILTSLVTFFCFSVIYATVDDDIQMFLQPNALASKDAEPQLGVVATIMAISTILELGRQLMKDMKPEEIIQSEVIPYHCDLAKAYGDVNRTMFEAMDNQLKVMMGGVKVGLERLQAQELNRTVKFEEYVSAMTKNPLLAPTEKGRFYKKDFKAFESLGLSNGASNKAIAEQVKTWFVNLIQDKDILDSTQIKIEDFANIAAASGAAVDSFAALLYKKVYIKRDVVDLGVIRYPDMEHPYLKMYRIELFAYRKSERILMVEKTSSGIGGTINVRRFIPRGTVISKLKEETIGKAVESAE
ncbi:hypothetical protein Ahia01_000264200, partial [Argonauta hians]